MDAAKHEQEQQQEEAQERNTSMEKKVRVLTSDSQEAGEPIQKHRGWKAMPYVIGNETFENVGTMGTLSNMLVYLTTVYHMQSASAATLLNVFTGTSNMATIAGAFVSDTYLGRYTTLAIAIICSFIGMVILTLTAAIHSLHPPACNPKAAVEQCQEPSGGQLMALLAAFFFLVVGAGGIRPCNLAFGADQFDRRTADGQRGITSYFNWYYFTYTAAMMVSATVIIYLQSNVNWALGLAVPAVLMGLSSAVFFMGTRLYVCVRPEGSPFTSFTQVLVAAVRKRYLHGTGEGSSLFNPPQRSKLVSKLAHTDQFACLDKAALRTPKDGLCADGKTPADPWRLCTMQQVEEVKCVARIYPVWLSGMVYFLVSTQLGNYVVLQAAQTDRHITAGSSFQIPQGSFVIFQVLALTLWIPVYDRVMVPLLHRFTNREGGITLLQRIGIGLMLSVATMLVAAAVEQRRRQIGPTMSWLWLVPQQVLAGLSQAFSPIGQTEFYYRQFPENMRTVAGALYFLEWAVAAYASGLMVTVVHRTTGWLAQDLDQGRLDLFYLVNAAIAAVNVVYFVVCARWYKFKKSDENAGGGAEDVDLDEMKVSANAVPVLV